jgi:hypothetical protein
MWSDYRRVSDGKVERTLHVTVVYNNWNYYPDTYVMREREDSSGKYTVLYLLS